MPILELLCLVIVGIHITVGAVRFPSARRYVWRAAVIAVASWLAEDTCLRLYEFYTYNPKWFPFVDRMPLMVALIWPGVVLSAWELAGRLLRQVDARGAPLPGLQVSPLGRPLVGGLLVLADASFMEPLAVRAGLWRWHQPGFFGVPPVGVLGWAYFSATVMAILDAADRRGRGPGWELLALPVAPLVTHAALLASWWGALRWVNVPIPGWAAAALAWAVGLSLAGWALRAGVRRRIPLGSMGTRIPAALFFFGLLWLHGRSDPALVAYALAFAPPYLALTQMRRAR